MHDSNLHINESLEEYPEPDVPVKDAWESMKQLLDNEDENDNSDWGNDAPKKYTKPNRIILIGFAGIIIFIVLFFFMMNKIENTSTIGKILQSSLDEKNRIRKEEKKDSAKLQSIKDKRENLDNIQQESSSSFTKRKHQSTTNFSDKMLHGLVKKDTNKFKKPRLNSGSIKRIDPIGIRIKDSNIGFRQTGQTNTTMGLRSKTKNFDLQESIFQQSNNNPHFYTSLKSTVITNSIGTKDLKKNYEDSNGIHLFNSHYREIDTSIVVFKNASKIDDIKDKIRDKYPFFEINKKSDFLNNKINDQNRSRAKSHFLNFLSFGFQWQAPIPLIQKGVSNYFTEYNEKNKIGLGFLIPSVFVSKQFTSKSSLQLLFNIAEGTLLKENVVSSDIGVRSTNDSTIVIKNKKLIKVRGSTIELMYGYQLSNRICASLGMAYTIQNKALIDLQFLKLTDSTLLGDSSYGINKSSSDWQYVAHNMLSIHGQIGYYSRNKFEFGLGFCSYPFKSGFNYPLSYNLFFRWKLLAKDDKRKLKVKD